MNRLIALLAALLLINGFIFAQGTGSIFGTVTERQSGESIPFASVALISKGVIVTGTQTDLAGKYAIRSITPGTYTLRVSVVGYQTAEITGVVVGADKAVPKDITLNASSIDLGAVEIIEHKVPIFEADQTSSGAIVTAEEISRMPNRAVEGNITTIGGVYSIDGEIDNIRGTHSGAESYYINGMQVSSLNRTPPSKQSAKHRKNQHHFQNSMYDAEEYVAYKENRFNTVTQEPLSTFSLDVDAAAYANLRRVINQGQLPQKDAVRIEELINYFSYDYPQPTGSDPVHITTEVASCPWNSKHHLVRIGVKAKEIASDNLPASNFVFLVDVSGSMYGATRLDLVKSSLKLLTNNLRDKDRVAIVVYAGSAGEVLPSTAGSDKQKILEALDNLTAGGSTAGGAGIQLAYKIAEKNFVPEGNNRIILCTDGDFNVGISANSELESLIESKRKTGIFLTVLGYGMGNYKDGKLQVLAEKGNGNHAYIDNIQEANKVLVNEFGGTMHTVAKDVKIQVEFNPAHVQSYRLIGYESRLLNKEDFNDDTKDAGELGSGHTVTALYEVIPVGVENSYGGVDKLKYQKNEPEAAIIEQANLSSELLTVKLRYKLPNESTSKKLEVPVLKDRISSAPSTDFNFIMAVAMFGQILKDSDFKGKASYKQVLSLAEEGIGVDKHGYRKEFIRLAESVNQLAK